MYTSGVELTSCFKVSSYSVKSNNIRVKDEATNAHYRAQMSQKLEKSQLLSKTLLKNHNIRAHIHDEVESEKLSTLKKQMDTQFREQESTVEPISPNNKTSKTASTFKTKLSASILKSKAWGTLFDEEQAQRIQSRKLKELELEHAAREFQKEQQTKEIKWFRSVGDAPMEEEQIQEVLKEREVNALKRTLQDRESNRERKKTEAKATERPIVDSDYKENLLQEIMEYGTINNIKIEDIGKEPEVKKPSTEPPKQETVTAPTPTPAPTKGAKKETAKPPKIEPPKVEEKAPAPVPPIVSLLEPSPSLSTDATEKGPPKLSEMDSALIKISEFPLAQSNASIAPLGNLKMNDPVFKDMEIIQLKVPLYYKIVGYKPMELTPIETYTTPRVPIDYTLARLQENENESAGASKMVVDESHVQNALKLQQRDRYYVPVNEYNDRVVPLKPHVLSEFDIEYYLASKNQNILFDLIRKFSRVFTINLPQYSRRKTSRKRERAVHYI
jgi:hypothetical protein